MGVSVVGVVGGANAGTGVGFGVFGGVEKEGEEKIVPKPGLEPGSAG